MSLLGAISDYYDSGDSPELTDLRELLGENKMYGDIMPPRELRPFVVLSEERTDTNKEPKMGSKRKRLQVVVVGFNVFAKTRVTCEAILEALEDTYIDTQLTIHNREHLGVFFDNRNMSYDGDGWSGVLELRYKVVKLPVQGS